MDAGLSVAVVVIARVAMVGAARVGGLGRSQIVRLAGSSGSGGPAGSKSKRHRGRGSEWKSSVVGFGSFEALGSQLFVRGLQDGQITCAQF